MSPQHLGALPAHSKCKARQRNMLSTHLSYDYAFLQNGPLCTKLATRGECLCRLNRKRLGMNGLRNVLLSCTTPEQHKRSLTIEAFALRIPGRGNSLHAQCRRCSRTLIGKTHRDGNLAKVKGNLERAGIKNTKTALYYKAENGADNQGKTSREEHLTSDLRAKPPPHKDDHGSVRNVEANTVSPLASTLVASISVHLH
eukprot:6459302-Amphidinium_carterae.1